MIVTALLVIGAAGLGVGLDPGASTAAATPGSRTAFTFSGTLAQPDGSYDFRFTMFGSPTGGTAVVGPTKNIGVAVAGAKYTTTVDFGADPFDGDARFLQVAWRVSGGTTFKALFPRVELVAVPYALGLRLPLAETSGAVGNALSVTNNGDGSAIAGAATGESGYGVTGSSDGFAGVYGTSPHNGVFGQTSSSSDSGIYGENDGSGGATGGQSGTGYGVTGITARGGAGVYGTTGGGGNGVDGQVNSATGAGVHGENDGAGAAVTGVSATGTAGFFTGGGSNPALALQNGGIRVVGAGVDTSTPVFIHTATASNICSSGFATTINNPFSNGNPNAIVFATNRNAFPVDAVYNWPGCPTGQWDLVFADSSDSMLANEAWNIMVVDP